MTLNFQNKLVFPAPETSYNTTSAYQQVVYMPRNIMAQVAAKEKALKTGHFQTSRDI